MKKTLLIATAFALSMTTYAAAQGEPIPERTLYLYPMSTTHIHIERPFKSVYVGDDGLLKAVRPVSKGRSGADPNYSDQDLIITTDRPDGQLVERTDLLLTDYEGEVIEKIHVEVTPFGQPSATVAILGWSDMKGNSRTKVYHCSPACVDAAAGRSRDKVMDTNMGNADGMSVTQFSDGSSMVTKSYNKNKK